jgi:protein TonB
MDKDRDEARNNRIGVMTSLGIHGILVLIFVSLMAWRAPNPPNPEFGIELNFGMDEQGSGEVQPQTDVGKETKQIAEEVKETPSESQLEEVKTESKEEVKDASDKTADKLDSKLESPVTVKEEKKEVKTDKKKKEKPVEKKKQEKLLAEFKKEDNKETANDASKKGDAGNQGDDQKKTGDKGSEEGKLDAKALYGTPGGGGGGDGLGLAMSGWVWAKEPKVPELPDNENGKVVFEIECDENGDIIGITTIERSLSPRSEQLLKEEIRKNSLQKISDGKAPERSKGRIIFILKTK